MITILILLLAILMFCVAWYSQRIIQERRIMASRPTVKYRKKHKLPKHYNWY